MLQCLKKRYRQVRLGWLNINNLIFTVEQNFQRGGECLEENWSLWGFMSLFIPYNGFCNYPSKYHFCYIGVRFGIWFIFLGWRVLGTICSVIFLYTSCVISFFRNDTWFTFKQKRIFTILFALPFIQLLPFLWVSGGIFISCALDFNKCFFTTP